MWSIIIQELDGFIGLFYKCDSHNTLISAIVSLYYIICYIVNKIYGIIRQFDKYNIVVVTYEMS